MNPLHIPRIRVYDRKPSRWAQWSFAAALGLVGAALLYWELL